MRSKIYALALIVGLALAPACSSFGPPPSVTTPAGKAAWNADQFVQRAGELQSAAILANQQGALSDKSSVTVVQFTVGAIKAAKETPNGWQATVLTGYDALKTALSPADLKTLAVPLATVDALIAALGGVR
jgi:hypothetical protein